MRPKASDIDAFEKLQNLTMSIEEVFDYKSKFYEYIHMNPNVPNIEYIYIETFDSSPQ